MFEEAAGLAEHPGPQSNCGDADFYLGTDMLTFLGLIHLRAG
jgi:hypothetical protein